MAASGSRRPLLTTHSRSEVGSPAEPLLIQGFSKLRLWDRGSRKTAARRVHTCVASAGQGAGSRRGSANRFVTPAHAPPFNMCRTKLEASLGPLRSFGHGTGPNSQPHSVWSRHSEQAKRNGQADSSCFYEPKSSLGQRHGVIGMDDIAVVVEAVEVIGKLSYPTGQPVAPGPGRLGL